MPDPSALPGGGGGSGAGGGRREAAAGGNAHGSSGGAAQQPQAPGSGKLPERSAGQTATGRQTIAARLRADMSRHIAVVVGGQGCVAEWLRDEAQPR